MADKSSVHSPVPILFPRGKGKKVKKRENREREEGVGGRQAVYKLLYGRT